jgi:EmrB/QacA subfamily drug resistance transporter
MSQSFIRPAGLPQRPRATLALLCVAQFVDVLGVTVVVVALPVIGSELSMSAGSVQWVVSAYALCFGGFLMLAGRAADLYGRRRLFAGGLAVFSVASLACGLAGSGPVLIAARAAQGIGAALVVPAALSLLTTAFPEGEQRTRALGIWTAAAAGGGATGFFAGGIITDALGWEWVFLLNVPLGLAALALTPRLLSESRAEHAPALDSLGAATVTAGLLALVFGLTRAEEAGPASAETVAVLGLAVGLLLAFVAVERRVRAPLLPPRVWRSRRLVGANAVAFTLTSTTSGTAVLATLYAQDVLDLGPTETGLVFLPFSLAVIAGSLAGSRLTPRYGARVVAAGGLAVVAGGLALGLGIAPERGVPWLLGYLVLAGAGLGAASVAATTTGTDAAREDEQGLAAGLLNTSTQIGTALGTAVLVTIASARSDAAGGEPVTGYEWGFAVATLVALAGVAVAARTLRR